MAKTYKKISWKEIVERNRIEEKTNSIEFVRIILKSSPNFDRNEIIKAVKKNYNINITLNDIKNIMNSIKTI